MTPRIVAGQRGAEVRGGERGRARAEAWEGGAARAGTRLFQPRLVGLHVSRPRPLRGAARALAGGLPAGAAARRRERRAGRGARGDVRSRARVPRRAGARARVVPARLRATLRRDAARYSAPARGAFRPTRTAALP